MINKPLTRQVAIPNSGVLTPAWQTALLAILDFVNGIAQLKGSATAAPTSGVHARGDIYLNSAPAAGGFLGWVCVTGGTPGTFKTFGAISP